MPQKSYNTEKENTINEVYTDTVNCSAQNLYGTREGTTFNKVHVYSELSTHTASSQNDASLPQDIIKF